MDPLAAEYPHNSPYAFSENRVMDMIKLEGLEGIKYEEKYLDSEGKTQIRTGIEADIYVAIGTKKWEFNATDPSKIESQLHREYNRVDADGNTNYFVVDGKEVRFKFNVQQFNSVETSPFDKASELRKKQESKQLAQFKF